VSIVSFVASPGPLSQAAPIKAEPVVRNARVGLSHLLLDLVQELVQLIRLRAVFSARSI
jgi:hypothetical protein